MESDGESDVCTGEPEGIVGAFDQDNVIMEDFHIRDGMRFPAYGANACTSRYMRMRRSWTDQGRPPRCAAYLYILSVLDSPGNVRRDVAAQRAETLRMSTRELIGGHGLAGDKIAGR